LIEDLLKTAGFAHAEAKVADPCPTKYDANIMASRIEMLTAGYPSCPLHSLTGIAEHPALLSAGLEIELYPNS
jgi:hypothetical protein